MHFIVVVSSRDINRMVGAIRRVLKVVRKHGARVEAVALLIEIDREKAVALGGVAQLEGVRVLRGYLPLPAPEPLR